MKENLFEVDNIEKSRILKLHSNIINEAYAENSVNVGGKIIPVSKLTMDFYNNAQRENKIGVHDTIVQQIKKAEDLNLLNDELKNKLGKSLTALIDKAFRSAFASGRIESNDLMKKIQKHLAPIANVTWKEQFNQYSSQQGHLKIEFKYPNLKYDSRTTEQKRDDNITKKNERFENIKKSYCNVKNGKLIVGNLGEKTWDWFVNEYKVTPEEINAAKEFCPQSELAITLPTVVVKGKKTPKTSRTVEKFPLVKGMYGPTVKSLQEKLGVKQTSYFWNLTQAAVLKRTKELNINYDPKIGLTEDDYTLIMES